MNTTLTGSSQALATIQRTAALFKRHGKYMFLRGEPGTGKSRLAQALAAEGAQGDIRVLEAWELDVCGSAAEVRAALFCKGPASGERAPATVIVEDVHSLSRQAQTWLRAAMLATDTAPHSRNHALILCCAEDWGHDESLPVLASLEALCAPFVLRIPPLRARPGDVSALLVEFLASQRPVSGNCVTLGCGLMERIEQAPWWGNVRELLAVLGMAVREGWIADGNSAHWRDVLEEHEPHPQVVAQASPVAVAGNVWTPDSGQSEIDDAAIQQAIQRTQGNLTLASKVLRMSRSSLYRRLREQPELMTAAKVMRGGTA